MTLSAIEAQHAAAWFQAARNDYRCGVGGEAAPPAAAPGRADATAPPPAEVDARAQLRAQAQRVLPAADLERLDAAPDRTIREAVLARVCPDLDFAGKTDAYLAGALEQAVRLGRLGGGDSPAEPAPSGKRADAAPVPNAAAVPAWRRPLSASLDQPDGVADGLKPIGAHRRTAAFDPRLPAWMQPLAITKPKP